jgi:hypothetical protein
MIMRTFAERYDFTGKTVLPADDIRRPRPRHGADEYADACEGATIGRGLPVHGERVRDAAADIDSWLRRIRLGRAG